MPASDHRLIVQAIKQLGRRVTAGDIAATTGLPVLKVNRDLNAVAADCQATIQVTSDGNLVYLFSPLFEKSYLKKGLSSFIRRMSERCFDIGYFLLRVSFGVTLIASLITVVALIVAAVISITQRSDSSSSPGSGGLNFDWLADLGNFFCFRVSYPGGGIIRTSRDRTSQPTFESDYIAYTEGRYVPAGTEDGRSQGFVLNCFSYLFGDGNPNADLEERRWQSVAGFIKSNNGVAIAEQLACYTGANPKREQEALPAIVRFDGQPTVSDRGTILYLFPSLQITALSAASAPLAPYLEEKRWPFSNQPGEEFIPVALFAFLNFIGCVWLFHHAASIRVLHEFTGLIDWLSLYALFFLLFPLFRYLVLIVLNVFIDWRNASYANNYKFLQQSAAKIAAAAACAIALNNASSEKVIYSTDRDILEQDFDQP